MHKYAIALLSLALVSTIAYAFTSSETLSERVERENRETLIRCLDEASRKSTTEEVLRAKNTCSESILTKIIAPISGTGKLAPIEKSEKPKQGLNVTTAERKLIVQSSQEQQQAVTTSIPVGGKKKNDTSEDFWQTYDLAIPLIRKYEGLHLKAYWDYKGYSIGYGTRAKHANEVITQAEADRRLGSIVKQLVTRVQRDFPTLTPRQQSGLVSFAFNCENGYRDVKKRGLDKHKYWCRTAQGVQLQGLVNRRLEEQTLIFN